MLQYREEKRKQTTEFVQRSPGFTKQDSDGAGEYKLVAQK